VYFFSKQKAKGSFYQEVLLMQYAAFQKFRVWTCKFMLVFVRVS